MMTSSRCPNPAGCDGELYARAESSGEAWCPKCGYVLTTAAGSPRGAHCPNPAGCDGELYARDDVGDAWCPKCGFVFRHPAADAARNA